jgi:hypothetical protein
MASADAKRRQKTKASEKMVKLNVPEQIKASPQHKHKISADPSSGSWYRRPPMVQSPSKVTLQRSISNATPRVTHSRTNSTWEFTGHSRSKSETQRGSVESQKRHTVKQSITRVGYPRVPSNDARNGSGTQHRPVRSATRCSNDSERTVVENERPTFVEAEEEKQTFFAKPAEDTLHPTVRLVSKPLPDLPVSDTLCSRWSVSTDSVYSADGPSSCGDVLDLFPDPPTRMPDGLHLNCWEDSCSLTTPPVFMSCSNPSSDSVATIPTSNPSTAEPPVLRAFQERRVAVVVHQNPRTSCSFSNVQDSIAVQRARACHKAPMKASIHTSSIRTVGTARRGSSSFSSYTRTRDPPSRVANIEALVRPHLHRTPEDIERIEQAKEARYRRYEEEEEKERELRLFEQEFGVNPHYKGKKLYERQVDLNGFELVNPGKKKRRFF